MIVRAIFFILLVQQLPLMCSEKEHEIDLMLYEKRLISQNGEDGVLHKIFDLIGTTDKYYIEFGAGKGHFCCNTKYLREKHGWKGLLLEGAYKDDPTINLHQEFITAENICELFRKYDVPIEFDLISIDIDRNDFYVWKALSSRYKPRVVVIESQSAFNSHEDKVIKYTAHAKWDGSEYTGASILALFNLGRKLGYSLVYQESVGVNLFFIRDDIIEQLPVKFKDINNVEKLYRGKPFYLKPHVVAKQFVSSLEVLYNVRQKGKK